MKTAITTILTGSIMLALATAASAQSPQIPTPANPYPINPIATDGTALPSQSDSVRSGNGIYTGRSASTSSPFGFVGNVAGAGLDTAGSVVGAGRGYGDEGYGYGAR